MNYTALGTLVFCAVYLFRSYRVFGMTSSISETFYQWFKHDWSVFFTIFCLVVGLGAAIQNAYPWEHHTKFLLSGAAGAMAFLGIATLYKQDGVVKFIHFFLAFLAIALGFAAIVWQDWQYLGAWALVYPIGFLLAVGATKRWWAKYYLYKVEVYAIVIIFGRLTLLPWQPDPLPLSSYTTATATISRQSLCPSITHQWTQSYGESVPLGTERIPSHTEN